MMLRMSLPRAIWKRLRKAGCEVHGYPVVLLRAGSCEGKEALRPII
jgi:hypothetical protein